jgi:DNA-binding MarR family transcriptional regulator
LDYARRTPHPSDRRTTLATITRPGRRAAEDATEALHAIKFGTPPLSKREHDSITAVLRRTRSAAGDYVPE